MSDSPESRPASSHAGSKPSGMWQPPSLEEMQAMLPQYQFVSLLGRGGMGAVYKAVQVSLDRPVAIKVLPGDLIDDTDAQFAERFKNEARTMAKMNHACIVNVYDFGETQTGLLYIVMEFIDGTDVAQMIASQGKLPPDYALAITAHVCDALNYAHSFNIVHRDIKPANILINMEGAVKVADFGLAKQSDAGTGGLTKTNMAMGTPDFVAPEALIPGMPVDSRADLYAIGVMLYQMLTGEIPRGMWTMPGMKLGTDPRFDAIIAKAMQTDREVRYQTAASIRRDLDVIMTTPPAAVKKTAEQRPQASLQRSADAPARNQVASKPADHALASTATKKSSTGFYLGMAAMVLMLGVTMLLFSGGEKPTPEPEPAGKTKMVAENPAPKPKIQKPAPTVPTPRVPLTAPAPTLTTKAVDVLPALVLEQDVVYGDWKMQSDGLAYGGRKGKVNSRVELPLVCSGSYVIEAEVSTVPTPGALVFHLPYAKENAAGQDDISFMVDHAKGQRAGFAYFAGDNIGGKKNPAWVDMASTLGQQSRLTVKVELKKPGRIAFSAWRDGRPLVGWEGDRSLTTGAANVWRPNNQPCFAIGTTLNGTVFHRIRVEALDGEIQWRRAPVTVEKTAPAPILAPPAAPVAATTMPAPAAPPPATSPAPTPADDPVSLKLADLESKFQAALERDVGTAYKAQLANLNRGYTAALDRELASATKSGKLDDAVALREEKQRIAGGTNPPLEDPGDLPESLKKLRDTWRTTEAGYAKNRTVMAAPLFDAYDRALDAFQIELTRQNKIDEALRVKAVRDYVSTQRDADAAPPAPPSNSVTQAPRTNSPVGAATTAVVPRIPTAPPLPADKVLPSLSPATQEDVRELCEWCLNGKSGKLEILEGTQRRTITSSKDLPKGRFTLLSLYIGAMPMDDDGKKWLAVVGRLPELESFFISGPIAGSVPVELLRGLTKVKSLRIPASIVDDVAFAHLSGLKSLESLAVNANCKQFTGTGLGYLTENLLEFATDSQTISAEGLAYLPRFKKLRMLDLSRSGVTDDMLRELAAMPDLEELNISDTKLDGSFLAYLPAKSKLKRINFTGVKTVKPENLVHLGKLKQLAFLNLPSIDPGREALEVIAGMDPLLELSLINNYAFSGEGFKDLKGFKGLKRLSLHTCPVNDAALEAVAASMPGLTSIEISNSEKFKVTITQEGLSRSLGRLKSLGSLNFHGERTTDDWIPAIAQFKGLTYLMLDGASVTDQGIAPLMKLPLGYLRLDSCNQITDAVVPMIKTCPTLTNVAVGNTQMTDVGKAELQRVLDAHKGK